MKTSRIELGNISFSEALKKALDMGYVEWFNGDWHDIAETIETRRKESAKAEPPYNQEYKRSYWYVPELHKIRQMFENSMHGITLRKTTGSE